VGLLPEYRRQAERYDLADRVRAATAHEATEQAKLFDTIDLSTAKRCLSTRAPPAARRECVI
jgi:hypothetical protein